jgi:hypothetical protein
MKPDIRIEISGFNNWIWEMNDIKIGLIAFLLVSSGWVSLPAQQTVSASGGNVAGTGGSVSYSIGQLLYSTLDGSGGTVAHGVQQPYEISVVSGIGEQGISLQCSAFPNPVADRLVLKIEGEWKSAIAFLFDAGGKLLKRIDIRSGETAIDMTSLVTAAYLLKVIRDGREMKVFKIIRH